MHKRFEKLIVKTKLPLILVVDFLAVCIRGRVTGSGSIQGNRRNYDALESDGRITISIVEDEEDLESKDDLIEPISMFLGAKLLGADVEFYTVWNSYVPDEAFLRSHMPAQPLEMTELICPESSLTLSDLLEVAHALSQENRPASVLLDDSDFRKLFPGIQTKYGDYGFIRHRSGTEIRTSWDSELLDSYGYETPNPVNQAIQAWCKQHGIEYEEPFGYKFMLAKWRLAKALNKVPAGDKMRVYQWVIETSFQIEDFHDSRGASILPDRLECEFANCILVADSDNNFELVEC